MSPDLRSGKINAEVEVETTKCCKGKISSAILRPYPQYHDEPMQLIAILKAGNFEFSAFRIGKHFRLAPQLLELHISTSPQLGLSALLSDFRWYGESIHITG